MRILYKINTLVLAAVCFMAVSCTKDNSREGTIKAKSCNYFDATPSETEITADCDTIELYVKSNVSWTLTADEGLSPSVTSGEGEASVFIEVPENLSFSSRSFSYSISTGEEVDVDDPQKWTEFGRTLKFSIAQAGLQQKFSVDSDSVNVAATATSVTVTLTANIGYDVTCQSSGLSCKVEDDPLSPSLHYLNFSFPANVTEEPVVYHATVTPASGSFAPISIAIRQSALKKLVLDCTNAGNFRYNDGAKETVLPDRGAALTNEIEFWLVGKPEYVFKGKAMKWGAFLNAVISGKESATSPIHLPTISGYVLSDVTVTAVKHTKNDYTYSITDGTIVLGSCKMQSTTPAQNINLSSVQTTSPDRYLISSKELDVRFTLTYVSVE